MNSYLVITAVGTDNYNVINQLTQNLSSCGGNILSTRMTSLGSEFAIMLLVEGNWGSIAKIETTLPIMEQKLGLSVTVKRTTTRNLTQQSVTYLMHVVTADRAGIINDLAQFFNAQQICIDDIHAHTYVANNGTRMSSLSMNLNIPITTHIPTLRERFNLYCDALNLDASLEPIRD